MMTRTKTTTSTTTTMGVVAPFYGVDCTLVLTYPGVQ
jgi:hypothetical protein